MACWRRRNSHRLLNVIGCAVPTEINCRSEPNDLFSAGGALQDGLVSTRSLVDNNTVQLGRRQDAGVHQWDDFSQDLCALGERKLQRVNANQSRFTVIEVYQTERNSGLDRCDYYMTTAMSQTLVD